MSTDIQHNDPPPAKRLADLVIQRSISGDDLAFHPNMSGVNKIIGDLAPPVRDAIFSEVLSDVIAQHANDTDLSTKLLIVMRNIAKEFDLGPDSSNTRDTIARLIKDEESPLGPFRLEQTFAAARIRSSLLGLARAVGYELSGEDLDREISLMQHGPAAWLGHYAKCHSSDETVRQYIDFIEKGLIDVETASAHCCTLQNKFGGDAISALTSYLEARRQPVHSDDPDAFPNYGMP